MIIGNNKYQRLLFALALVFIAHPVSAQGYDTLGVPPRPSLEIRPLYSPDGKFVAFNSNRGGLFDIYILEVATGKIQQLTKHRGNNYVPKWSPDGKQLLFYSNYWGNPWTGEINHDIYRVNSDGSEMERVLVHSSNDMFADWLPNGKSCVFASTRERQYLYTKDFETGKVSPLLKNYKELNFSAMFQPWVHPKSGNMVFEGYRDGIGDIWLYNLSTGEAKQLTFTPKSENGPSISPDGTKILFQIADENKHPQIGMVDIDGKNYKVLTRKGGYTTPVWGPSGNIITAYTAHPDSKDPKVKNWNLYTLNADGTGLQLLLDW